MRAVGALLLLSGLTQAAWPFAKAPAAAVPGPAAVLNDPFLDAQPPPAVAHVESKPAPLAAQDPEGTTIPVASGQPAVAPTEGPPVQITHQYHGIWDKLLPSVFGPVPLGTTPYDGPQYRYGPLRIRPRLFVYEGIVLLLGLAYALSVRNGTHSNNKRASGWVSAARPLLESQFSRVENLKAEGSGSFWLWATGRRNVRKGARIHITLKPRGDVLLQLYEVLRGIIEPTWTGASADRVEIEVPIETGGDYIVAIADKGAISKLRENYWNLATFAPVGESAQLPDAYCTMTEVKGVQEALLSDPQIGLPTLLGSDASLESLVISDIVDEQPSEATLLTDTPVPKDRKITLTLRLADKTDSFAYLATVFNLVDLLAKGKPALPEGAAGKVSKRRAEIVGGLRKPLLEEQRDERERKAAEAKRKSERERKAALTPAQEAKEAERERKRAMKKQQNKMIKR